MVLKTLLVVVSVAIVGVAILGYHPLPSGIRDPLKVQVQLGIFNIFLKLAHFADFLGYGSLYSNFRYFHTPPKVGDPVTASYGGLKVTRDKLAGVPVIIYKPKNSAGLYPAIVFFHGGGWILGSADSSDKMLYQYAIQTQTVIINVDYRLAPDHPFPVPAQDCLDVTRFVLKHGSKYNVDVNKVGVAGDSAGGNLAGAVALHLSKEKSDLPPLLFQILHYPALQGFDFHLPAYIDHNHSTAILTQGTMCAMYAMYMGLDVKNIDHYTTVLTENRHIPAQLRKSKYAEYVDVKLLPGHLQKRKIPAPAVAAGHDEEVYAKIKDVVTNPLFSPLMAPDLTGLPAAFVHVAEFDVLRDDAILYARRLQQAGVKVEEFFGTGGFHGDASLGGFLQSGSGKDALAAAYKFVRRIVRQ